MIGGDDGQTQRDIEADNGQGAGYSRCGAFFPQSRKRLSGPGLRSFLTIADLWRLDEQQRLLVLGLPSRSTYYNWVKAVRERRDITLDVDVLMRLSAVLGIHQALGVLYADEKAGIHWLHTPNQAGVFGGHPPLRLVASGLQDGLLTVRRFLDARAGFTWNRMRSTASSGPIATRTWCSREARSGTTAELSSHPVALSADRSFRHGRHRRRPGGGDGTGRLDQ